MFSAIRRKGGYNDNPTVTQARAALKSIVSSEILSNAPEKSGTNCEPKTISFLLPSVNSLVNFETEVSSYDSSETPEFSILDLPLELQEVTIVDESSSSDSQCYFYVGGYFLKRFIKCDDCRVKLSSQEPQTSFVKHKQFINCSLKDPIHDLVTDLKIAKEKVFLLLSQIAHLPNLVATISNHSELSNLFCYSFLSESCRNTIQKTLLVESCKFFIKLFCSRKNDNLKTKKKQQLNKFKKLLQ